MHGRPLGGQQLRRLRELRAASDTSVREQHLQRDRRSSSTVRDVQPPVDRFASRTVDAIVQERAQDRDGVSTSIRLRDKVTAARRGIQTERSERKQKTRRPVEKPNTTRKIAAVRRRAGQTFKDEGASDTRRRMGKQEAEWVEKQLQYRARAAMLEKDCQTAWQSFFAGAGSSAASEGVVSTVEVNKLMAELGRMRELDSQKMRQELNKLNTMTNDVQLKVEEIQNGSDFLSELQDRIDVMEAGLGKFRLLQRKQFEGYVLEEKVLEKETDMFMEKMNEWENETPPRLVRGGASATSLGPRLVHIGSKVKLDERCTSSSPRQGQSNNDEEVDDCSDTNQIEDRAARTGTPDEIGMVNRVRRLNDAILRSGGLKGGWDHREHATFTALLVKCGLSDDILLQHLFSSDKATTSNQESNQHELSRPNLNDYETQVARFLRKCMRKVVTQTESSVRSHFEWYLRHLEFIEEKKRVIHEWKIRKEEERLQIIQCGFEADGEVPGNTDHDGALETNHSSSRKQRERTKLKSREKTDRLLEQWKLEKKRKDEEHGQRRRELQKKREAVEAKRKQEQLDAKQKVLLYKLQKEQDAMMLDRTGKLRQEATDDVPLPIVSPTSKEELVERSRIALEYAKAKRLRLQQIEERKQKQNQLPPRPETKGVDESASNNSPKQVLIFNSTEASRARDLSKDEIRKQVRQRERQNAHDAFIPGKKAIPDVKFKSFGHLPIQPRAVPAWRKNI